MDNQYQTIYQTRPERARDFRKIARKSLKGFWWTAILVTLIASLLGGVALGGSVNFNFNFGSDDFESPDYSDPDYTDPDNGYVDDNIEEESTFTPEQMETLEKALADFDFGTIGDIFSEVDPVLGMVFSLFGIIFVVVLVLTLAFQLFVSSPVKVGYQRFVLEVIDGNESEINVNTLFRFFKQNYGKTIALNFVHTLILDLTMIPMFAGMIVGGIFFTAALPELFTGSIDALLTGVLPFVGLTTIGVVVSLFISIPVSYAYSMAHMIMADYPNVGVIQALRLSRQMMKGNKFRLFCLDFSFFGWYLLGACACGLGGYIVTPYQYTARAAFYSEISNRRTPDDVEFPSIDPEDYYID